MIGILGGTFDPIHNGHLQIASRLVESLSLQQIQFMPSSSPVHRGQPRATAKQRCEMIQLALDTYPDFRLNALEVERGGPSYSIDSLRFIKQDCDSTLVLILGTDAFNEFDHWESPEEILQLVHLVVCHRPGYKVNQKLFRDRQVDTPAQLLEQSAGAILALEVDANDCSSSTLRDALNKGILPTHCLPPSVAAYIDKHNLYRSSGD